MQIYIWLDTFQFRPSQERPIKYIISAVTFAKTQWLQFVGQFAHSNIDIICEANITHLLLHIPLAH